MIKRTALSLAICLAGAFPSVSSALGLGELQSDSQLNQPLRAKINLLSTTPSEARQLKVRLASPEVFSRVGIDRPGYLNSLRFSPSVENGKPVIRVSSSQPINEPFLNFLLEVSWPQGQLLKEYTVLLDPPVLMQSGGGSSDAAAVRAEPRNTGMVNRQQEDARRQQERQRQIQLQRQRDQEQQRLAAQQRNQQAERQRLERLRQQRQQEWEASQRQTRRAAAPTRSAPKRTARYRVKRGDTLYRVARKLRKSGVTNQQMMVALFRANPQAFRKNNMNYLKSGVTIKRPPVSDLRDASRGGARKIVRQHHADWRKFRSGAARKTVAQKSTPTRTANNSRKTPVKTAKADTNANLKVVGSGNKSVKASKASASDESRSITDLRKELALAQEQLASSQSENKELRDRVSRLEAIVRKKDRLINLKSERLAELEASLKASNDGVKAPEVVKATTPETTRQTNNGFGFTSEPEVRQPVTPDPVTPPVTTPDPVKNVTDMVNEIGNKTQNQDGGILRGQPNDIQQPEVIKEPVSPFVGGGDEEKEEGGILDFLGSPMVTAIGGGSLLALLGGWALMRRRKVTAEYDDMDDSYIAPDLDEHDDFDAQVSDFEQEINEQGYNDLDDHDVSMSTSDDSVHKKPATAAAVGANAIDDSDDDLHEDELLQEAGVYIVYGLHDQAEEELKKAIDQHPNRLEYRHKLLENYQVANNKDAFIDGVGDFLNAEGDNKQKLWDKIRNLGKSITPDNDLFDQKSVVAAASSFGDSGFGGVAASLGAAGAAVAGAAALAGSKASDAADSVGDSLSNAKDTVGDKLSDGADAFGNAFGDAKDAVTDKASDAFDAVTPESDDLDLDIDFDDLGGFGDESLGKMDEDTGLDLDLDDLGFDDEDFDLTDLDNSLNEAAGVAKAGDAADAIKGVNLDIDQDSGLDRILPTGNTYATGGQPEKDFNSSSHDDFADDALSFLDLPDDDLDMQEAHISTKLDLARAYLDMGDVEGARSTLEEVVNEGNDEQRREAQQLLHQTG